MSIESRLAKLEAERPAEPLVMIWMKYDQSEGVARERYYSDRPDVARSSNEMFIRWQTPDEEAVQ
jgi:hypothetical protein